MGIRQFFGRFSPRQESIQIEVSRADQCWKISPEQFESFPFENGDRLAVTPPPGENAPGHMGRHPCPDLAKPRDSCSVHLSIC